MRKLTEMNCFIKFNGCEDKLTYAQEQIIKKTKEKISCTKVFQDYGTDYNDCHGDYYDAEAEN